MPREGKRGVNDEPREVPNPVACSRVSPKAHCCAMLLQVHKHFCMGPLFAVCFFGCAKLVAAFFLVGHARWT